MSTGTKTRPSLNERQRECYLSSLILARTIRTRLARGCECQYKRAPPYPVSLTRRQTQYVIRVSWNGEHHCWMVDKQGVGPLFTTVFGIPGHTRALALQKVLEALRREQLIVD